MMDAITTRAGAAENVRDLELVARLRTGNPGALDELMGRYASRVFRLARGITRSDADAEEVVQVVQDVFFTLVRKYGTFEGRAALGSWIYRIATNAALNKRRGKRFAAEVPLEDLLPTFKADGHREGDPTFLLADWSQSPEQELLSNETWRVLNQTHRRSSGSLPGGPGAPGHRGAVQRGGVPDARRDDRVGEVQAPPRADGPPRAPDATSRAATGMPGLAWRARRGAG
jgi:RNA polymerase sigma factor (sigma-70 family)